MIRAQIVTSVSDNSAFLRDKRIVDIEKIMLMLQQGGELFQCICDKTE